jgi:ArpU family phage transcriptional regulator
MIVAVDPKMIEEKVVLELTEYPLMRVKVENIREQEEKGINPFPSFRDRSKFEEIELRVRQIERSLSTLNSTQRKIIEMKYIDNPDNISDTEIYNELLLIKKTYYIIRKKAINKIAEALGII